MSEPASTGPPSPPPRQLDPIAEALGELKAAIARLDERSIWLVRLIGGLYLVLLSGLTVIGWLVTRHG
jgi:hypothetical protein